MKKKILLIAPYPFYLLNSGGRVLIYNNCVSLSNNFDLTVMFPYPGPSSQDKEESIKKLFRRFHLIPVEMPHQRWMRWDKICYIFHYMTYFFSSRFVFGDIDQFYHHPTVLRQIQGDYDLIQLEQSYWYHPNLKKRQGKFVLTEHNFDYRYWLEMARSCLHQRDLLRASYQYLDSRKVLAREKEALRDADLIFSMSYKENKILQKVAGKDLNIHVIPPGLNVHENKTENRLEYRQKQRPKEEGEVIRLIYVGSLYLPRSADGIIYFIRSIMPKVESAGIPIKLFIIGQDPVARLVKLCEKRKNVILAGFVDDIQSCYEESDICLIPIQYRSGIRFKLMEAMFYGKPIVSTSGGTEGLDITSGGIIIVDQDDKFAEAIIKLAKDAEMRRQYGRLNKKYAEQYFDYRKNFIDVGLPLYEEMLRK